MRRDVCFGGDAGRELLAYGAEVIVVILCGRGFSILGFLEESPGTRSTTGIGVDLLDLKERIWV